MTTYAFRFKFWGCSVSKCQAASAIDIGSCERCQRHYWADNFVLQIISAKRHLLTTMLGSLLELKR
ncbi:hypothetical protein N7533_003768 [Penicillium manginii]|uniref:uncharacterized protein n=1 Tax=Penicillium manginii TaxID=203109 RepID=UPI0025476EBF|nr:uncharacterized protein N7533_003768 [Penicillium manginii]KAJ5754225.1 hypothetical protein N7533_003768 [Penicillium manginii]